jgi:hypothetical protein
MEVERKERSWKQYFTNIVHVVRGEENFVGSTTPTSDYLLGFSVTALVFTLIIAFAVCYGAASLSWCYNTYNGESDAAKFVFSILCFFFPNFYYPFYALFLNPLCGKTKNQSGGSRRH